MNLQQIMSPIRRAIDDYMMIEDGDKIAVGLSGGKDSITLLSGLAGLRRFYPKKFDLVAIRIDTGLAFDETECENLKNYIEELGVEYIVEKTEIASVVFDVRKESNPCALCSKMRKGALNNLAKKLGCNKVALGHHRDDAIDTLLLSLLYEGRLSTFAPKSYLDKIDLTLIRPMILIKEMNIIAYSKTLPIVKSCCPANKMTKREYVKDLIKKVGEDIPNVRDMLFTALFHPERYNLFDKFENDIDTIL